MICFLKCLLNFKRVSVLQYGTVYGAAGEYECSSSDAKSTIRNLK